MRHGLILLVASLGLFAAQSPSKVGGKIAPDGKSEVHCDLPASEMLKNKGGSDRAGLCVFTSCEHSARFQAIPALVGFRDWMTRYPGGGYPSKLKAMIEKLCQEKNVPVPEYIQIQGKGELLPTLKAACESGRMPAVTYSFSPTGRYGGRKISHMVSLVHLSDEWACILDNNFPGPENLEWIRTGDFLRTFTGGSNGWAVIFAPPGPPPLPFTDGV
jgi:hypothetical protein